MQNTLQEFDHILSHCADLFGKKLKDYGPAWRIMRLSSVTDQIFIKAQRIRTLQEKQIKKVDEDEASEFVGIINYSIIALIQLELGRADQPDLSAAEALKHYQKHVQTARNLLAVKNHDYGEVWRGMRVSSITDIILQKILRIKQIEDNQGKTLVSEGLEANYLDMINYAVFALILLDKFTGAA